MASPRIFGSVGKSTARIMIDAALDPSMLAGRAAVVLGPGPDAHGADWRDAWPALAEADGAVIAINADTCPVPGPAQRASVATFGLSPAVDYRASDVHATLDGTAFTLQVAGQEHRVSLKLLGEHQVTAALAAIALGHSSGMLLETILPALERVDTLGAGRMERLAGPDGTVIINDTVSATPESMAAALKTLALVASGRRSVAILGELSGVDDDPVSAHDRIGRLVVRLNVKKLVVVGQEARHLHHAAGLEGSWDGESVLVDTPGEAYDLLRDELRSQDIVLVKAASDAGLGSLAERLAVMAR